MKLLLLTSALERGGAETHVCALAAALARKGHRVTVVSGGGTMAEALRQAGISHVTLPLNTHCPWRLLLARRRLKQLMRNERYAVVHAHARIPSLISWGPAKRLGIPLVTTVHAHFRASGIRRRLSRWGDRTIAVSEDLKQYLCEEYALPSERIRVIPNGIDTRAFSPLPKEGTDKLRLVFLSRLDEDCSKGAFLLCELAERLREAFPTLEIVIAGGGSALEALRRRAEEINRRWSVPLLRLCGHLENPTALLRSADVFLGVSRAALEAMACGVPVILGGDEGFLGVLDPSMTERAEWSNFCCRGDEQMRAEVLYDAIFRLLSESAEERAERGRMLAEYVKKSHSLEAMAEETIRFYAQTAAEYPRPTAKKGVTLCGYYGYGNTGDDALLRAAVARARKAFPHRSITALTRGGRRDEPRFGVRCLRRTSPLAVSRALKSSSHLIFGGGTLLQDATSLRSLLYYCALLRIAQKQGVRTELWANGLGEPRTEWSRRWMRSVLTDCARIGVRDAPSMALAQSLVGEQRAERLCREEDLALSTLSADPQRIGFLLGRYRLTDRSFAVIAVREGGREILRNLAKWLTMLRAERVTLLFVPMFPKEDGRISRRFCLEFDGVLAEGLSGADLVGLMGHARLVCGMRLHALVFAACADTPFVGFGSDPKLQAFCREHGGLCV